MGRDRTVRKPDLRRSLGHLRFAVICPLILLIVASIRSLFIVPRFTLRLSSRARPPSHNCCSLRSRWPDGWRAYTFKTALMLGALGSVAQFIAAQPVHLSGLIAMSGCSLGPGFTVMCCAGLDQAV
jgi:hypothetical protein